MSLLLIRHGETAFNVKRVLQPAATPLSARGQAQAVALACRLASAGLVGIVSSDLPRARQTAEQLALATGLGVATTPLLQERNFGDLRGKAYDELPDDPLQMSGAPPGGESMAQFLDRVDAAFTDLLQRQAALGGRLAVVSHGLVIKAILDRHGSPAAGQLVPARMRNGSLSIVLASRPHLIELLDCASHLDGDADLAEPAGNLSGG